MAATVTDSESLKWQNQSRQFAVGQQSQELEKDIVPIESIISAN
jgi:hypothetical protein